MRLLDALSVLRRLGPAAFRTAEAAAALGLPRAGASKALSRLARAGHLIHLGHGHWGVPDRIGPWDLPGLFSAPLPAGISLQSALHHHGLIAQIPSVLYAVTPGRTRRIETPLGAVSLHHVPTSLFFGYEPIRAGGPAVATPEKALIDFLYLSPARSRLFAALPEVELPRGFRITRARDIIARIPSVNRRQLIRRRFDALIGAGR